MSKQVLRLSESELIKLIQVIVSEQTQIVTDFDRAFDYKKEGNKFYFKGKGNFAEKYPEWIEPTTDKALDAIKTKVFKISKTSYVEPISSKEVEKNQSGKKPTKVLKTPENYVRGSRNYIIGDSQTPFIDMNSDKATRLGKKGSEEVLWKGGIGLSWLKSAVRNYPISPNVNSIIINIGTNGGFNPNDDVSGLVSSIMEKFPNAKILAVQGSWGWGGNKKVTQQRVNNYYNKFRSLGVTVVNTPIGKVKDPHGNLPVYAEIGKEIDNLLS